MRKLYKLIRAHSWIIVFFMGWALFPNSSAAQQLRISDFVLFGGNGNCPTGTGQTPCNTPGCAVQIGSSSNINGGSIGSYKLVKTTGSATIAANIYSGGTVQLANSNAVSGKITAANSQGLTSAILSVGSNASLGGNIDIKGNIVVSGGTVSGRVTHPSGTTYSGPVPAGGNVTGTPSLPILPDMPAITSFPAYGTTDITSTATISPGVYRNISLSGNKTLTLSGPGIYVFKSIKNTGNSNNFVFNFQNTTTGNFLIYIHGDADLNKVSASMINGGSATRIYSETHGTGSGNDDHSVAWQIANGSSGSNTTKWLGSIWSPYAAINVGSGSGSSEITGALWSGTQVNIQSGVTINYAPFQFCTPPNADAGPDKKTLDFANPTTLAGTSTTPGVTFNWEAINGGVITSPVNAPTITVSSAGTYVLTVTSATSCFSKDTAIVTGKVNDIIGSELQAVIQNGGAPSPFFEIKNGKIFIDVIVKDGEYAYVKGKLKALGGPWFMTDLLGEDASNFIITGLFPINKLADLNTDSDLSPRIIYARPYYRAFNNTIDPPATGVVTSQGDTSIRTNLIRKGYNLSGEGIKIGVLSNSFNTIAAATNNPVSSTAAQDVINGDLPGPGNPNGYLTPVTVLKDATFPRSDEGRAMLQIIHDIAPKAQLYFRTGVETASDFAAGIRELKAAGCDVITEDLTYITEPFLKDGVVAAAVQDVTAAGATYITSAGNFANKSFEFPFDPIPAPGGLAGSAHNFSGGDAFLSVNLTPGNYTIVLQWIDDIYSQGETGGTQNDLDIYLTPNTNGTALFGFNRNNLHGDPIEFLPFTLTAATQTNFLIINNTTTSNPARFKVVIFQGNITFNEYVNGGGSTIIGQSNAPAAITVGAARYDKVAPYTTNSPVIESFSSIGGTVIAGTPRNKPDLVGPDGVNTTVNMGIDQIIDADVEYSNFLGTSAAAPHVAGVAALIMEGKRKFLNQASVSPAEMKTLLQSTATDMGTPGFDLSSGAGFVNADAAMRTFAAPDPTLIQLHVPTGITPGATSFTLTVTGLNLSPTSVIKFRDSTLAVTYLSSGRDTAKAVVPQFIGDPGISVYTPPVITNGIDGGTSDTLKFFGVQKKNIVVKADNKSKKYAQSFPAFTATITVNGVPLSELPAPGLTLQQLGLDNMTITSSATSVNTDVGTYIITPSRIFDPNNSTDVGLKELYNYTFTTGTMTIEKLPITVTAQNLTATYGEKLPDIEFSYAFTNVSDATTIPNPGSLLSSLQSSHQGQLAKDVQGHDILGLVNGQAVTIENGQAVTIENGQAVTIENGQAVTIENGIRVPVINAQALTIVNGVVVDTSGIDLTANQVSELSFLATTRSLQNVRQVTNQKLINGTYVTNSTSVVDITQESILDYNVNAAQTYMLNSISNVDAKGLVDVRSYTNGQAVTIENGQAVTIENGQAVTIENGQAVTIENGQAVTIENGVATPIVSSHYKTAVIVDRNDIGQGISQFKSVNTITGLDAGAQFIIPGTLLSSNFEVTHVAGLATIQPAPVVITPTPGQNKIYGDADPVFTYTNNAGLTTSDFTGAISRVSGSNVGTYFYTLGNLSAGSNYILSIGGTNTFAITARSITITPDAGQSKVYGNADPTFTYLASEALQPGDSYNGALGRVAGNNVGAYFYTLGTLSAGSNYALSIGGTNTFAITARSITITPDAGQSKVYGNADPTFTYLASEALQPGDSYNGALGRVAGNNVGTYFYTLGTLSAGNNYAISLGGTNKFSITTRSITIIPTAGQSKLYGNPDPIFTYTGSEALQPGDSYSGALGRVAGSNIGTYAYTLGNLSAGLNYSLTLSTVQPVATFAINPKPVLIAPNSGQSKIYGDSDPVFAFTNNAGLTASAFTGALGRASGSNVGTYAYTLGTLSAGSNYSLSLAGTNTFAITKAPLQVKADLKWINKGDPLPTFTSIITGLKNGDNPTLSYTLSPTCTGSAGVYTIIPLLNPFANSINYTITYINSQLYINPKGSGADDVDTYLQCIEDRGASFIPQNRRYVAHFYSKNTNSTPVYVPVGANNSLTSSGSFDGSQQPVIFMPGNGTTTFNVPFDGISLKWQLKTYENYTLVTESVTASSSSIRCSSNTRLATTTTTTSTETTEVIPVEVKKATVNADPKQLPAGIEESKTTSYPNPATNRVVITVQTGLLSEKGLSLYDVNGRSYMAKVTRRISQNSLELDVSGLANGLYLITIKQAGAYSVIRFVKG